LLFIVLANCIATAQSGNHRICFIFWSNHCV